jgi:hypothetical protein
MTAPRLVALAATLVLALGRPVPAAAELPTQDWVRTETRTDCTAYDPLRQPFFGETHIHTSLSGDAAFVRVRTTPRDAYMFALGDELDLPPYDPNDVATRSAQIRRPLDFTAVTEHAEFLGEIRTCLTMGLPGYDHQNCIDARDALALPLGTPADPLPPIFVTFQLTITSPTPMRMPLCGAGDVNCLTQAGSAWQEIQDAAEEFYDRSAACDFTTFVGYEWTNNLNLFNLHRNIIFRNAEVPALPKSYYERPLLEDLFTDLETECLGVGNCDFLSIPHNSNVSGGLMFAPSNANGTPLTKAGAARRATHEPLVEIFQHKGNSECHPRSTSPNDEFCGFEQLNRLTLFTPAQTNLNPPPLNFTREALKEGLRRHNLLGANPFEFGLIGSTDGHGASAGGTVEEDFGAMGHLGVRDATPTNTMTRIGPGGVVNNGGGLAVLYAEENSRDALFAAMRRREAYATSGTRPIVRFFAGLPGKKLCESPDFVEEGYTTGVPMGGELGPVLAKKSPRFAILAMKDPGGNGEPSTPLQRLQVVKGWVDEGGQTREVVYDVAGDPNNGATVDLDTCVPSGAGFDTLCTVWKDPKFKAEERAFYYVRVLENPVCRWTTRLCNEQGIDCDGVVPPEFSDCCSGFVDKTIQERAWTSPIFYHPERFGLKGDVKLDNEPGKDKLKLQLTIGKIPPALNVETNDFTITVSDDDEIYTATLPAGSFEIKAPGTSYQYKDKEGLIDGVKLAQLKITKKGNAKIKFQTVGTDLPNADPSTHRVEVRVTVGDYDEADSRIWELKGTKLKATK